MRWFETQLAELDRLAEDYRSAQCQPSGGDIVSVSEDIRRKRGHFIDAVQELVDNVFTIKGITACAAYHEGLVLASSGLKPNLDALGAVRQDSLGVARRGGEILNLGDIRQIVIVGSTDKVAMVSIGPVMLCIASPKDVNLASVLNRRK